MKIAGILASFTAAASPAPRTGRLLALEPLESRLVMDGLPVDVPGVQPAGGLSGKIVYVHGGHGFTAANTTTGAWGSQRPLLLGMVEDLGNKDQMDFLVDYLFRAGATVAPLRPVGHQPLEDVLDNDDTGVTFSGAWSNASASVYFGSAGDVPYRFATTSATETAVARYQPDLPADGFYPVYTWVTHGANRATDQLYRVHHSGGATEVTVDHSRVGNGLVYLGTYFFNQGATSYVEISNRSSDVGRVVVADMIRFGNGRGDINRGGGVSGLDREDEAGLYWVQWHVERSQGIPTSEYRASTEDASATVSLSPRYAEFMNRESTGVLSDRVFVSFHSNAGGGSARGVLGLYNGNNYVTSRTPNQLLLAQTLAQEVNNDLVAQNGSFEHNWFNNGTSVTLDRSDIEFGEINNLYINDEFDATIIETGYHDNTLDAQMLRDPRVRDAIARATYQGIVKYFRQLDGGATPATATPGTVRDVRAQLEPGGVTVRWTAPTTSSVIGDAPTAYRVYASLDGYGYDAGTLTAGAATSLTFAGLDPSKLYYFRVAAVNAGGESPLSEAVAASASTAGRVLVVNGFDRLDRTLNPTQPYLGGGVVERVRPRFSNSFDYVAQLADAIHAARPLAAIDTAANELVANGTVDLAAYDAVFWILGEESSANRTFDANEQTRVSAYLAGGGKLFLSGAEIGWDLDSLNNGRTFYNNTLRADYVSDDAGTYQAVGVGGSIFAGVNLAFDNGAKVYDVNFPDVITPLGGATAVLNYQGGSGGAAAIAHGGGAEGSRLVMLAFPFETIVDRSDRLDLMDRVLDFFAYSALPPANADFNGDGAIDAADYTVWRDTLGQSVTPGELGDANFDGTVDSADYDLWRQQFGSLAPAEGPSASLAPAAAAASADPATSSAPEPAPTAGFSSSRLQPQLRDSGVRLSATLDEPSAQPLLGRLRSLELQSSTVSPKGGATPRWDKVGSERQNSWEKPDLLGGSGGAATPDLSTRFQTIDRVFSGW